MVLSAVVKLFRISLPQPPPWGLFIVMVVIAFMLLFFACVLVYSVLEGVRVNFC